MRKILLIMILLQGVLLSASVEELDIKGVKTPIIFEVDKSLPIVSMQMIFQNTGSIRDGSLAGLGKFTAKMLNEGTKTLGAVGFATKLEDSAIELRVHSGTETFVFEISALKEKFPEAIALLKALITDPNMTEETFAKIKILMQANIKRKESDFDYIASLNLKEQLYQGTPVGHASSGDLESIEKITLQHVKAFMKDNLIQNQVLFVVGGDIDKASITTHVKEVMDTLDKGDAKELTRFKASPKAEDIEVYKESEQAYIYFGGDYNLSNQDADVYKAKVAGFILGAGGFGSRLMEEVRVKRGLAYSAYAKINFAKSHSDFSGYLQTKLDAKEDAINLVKEVIAEFVAKGVSADELEQAKKFLLGSEPLRNETLSQRLSRSFQEYYNGFELGHAKNELKKIEALTLEDLNSFIKSHAEINNLTFSVVTKK